VTEHQDYDAVIVGASLAGCATAIFLARAGARVALIEKRPDPAAFKRVCGHFIQSSAIATLQRLGLLQAIEDAGGLHSRVRSPNGSIWMTDPQWGAAFPTDDGTTMYAAMPTKERLPEFRRDPTAALIAFVADLPEAPPILASTQVGPTIGKIEMPNVMRTPTAPGLALVGDAAFATDPLFGVGCGWAFQSAEWLADSVAPGLAAASGAAGHKALVRGLRAYRRRHTIALRGHAFLIHGYATGRRFNPVERLLFSSSARDAEMAGTFEAFGTRNIGPTRLVASGLPRALAVNLRHTLRRHSRESLR
jgi:flavin-dependent dehydrogenase